MDRGVRGKREEQSGGGEGREGGVRMERLRVV